LKVGCFGDATGFIKNATEELKRHSQYSFQECFQPLYNHWQKCIVAQGDYFEGNVIKFLYCYVFYFGIK
jgi:hypothetical protein